MLGTADSLCLGSPQFADPAISALGIQAGHEAAWRAAWERSAGSGLDAAKQVARSVDGNFAVAITLPNGQAFMAVDCFAEQTMCYRLADGRLRFAERSDALADNGEPAVSEQAIFDYLFHHCIPSPRTIFKEVHRLPPGHCAYFDGQSLHVDSYWVPSFVESPRALKLEDAKQEFRDILRRSVRRRLDGTQPACFLSGGTDSSTVAGMISELAGKPAQCYSIGFEAEGYDEMAYARIAARHFGCDHHEYYVTPQDLVDSIAEVAAFYDQPFGNSSALPAYYCALKARENGATRILAGDGGDELFGGNTRYAKQRVFDWYQSVPLSWRRNFLEPFFGRQAIQNTPWLKKGSSYIRQANEPMPDRLDTYNLLLRLGIDRIFLPDFISLVDIQGPATHERATWQSAATGDIVNRMLAFDWRYTLAESDLPKVRGTCDLAGIEVAFPMLDRELLDFSMRLPVAYKLKGLKLRWFFKEALKGFLPGEILTKKKQGFGLPFGVWMTRHTALKGLAADSLASLATRGIVRPAFIHELINHRLAEHPAYFGEMVWILMMLEQWMQKHAPATRF